MILVVVAIVAVAGHQQFVTAWSNHCDPGNAQFNLLKNDPVVNFRTSGELFTWENDGPDNGWTCTNPTLSMSHVGQDLVGILQQTRADMTDAGWKPIDVGGQGHPDFYIYEKNASRGVRLTAVVLQNAFWIEVDLSAPGLHPGEQGF
jgi:hypothetical protein